jgi:antitoxin ParD1/3/4
MTKVELSPRFERFVQEQVANGNFASETEVLEAALARMEVEEAGEDRWLASLSAEERQALTQALEHAIAEADAGLGMPVEEVFDRLEAKYRVQAESEDGGAGGR